MGGLLDLFVGVEVDGGFAGAGGSFREAAFGDFVEVYRSEIGTTADEAAE